MISLAASSLATGKVARLQVERPAEVLAEALQLDQPVGLPLRRRAWPAASPPETGKRRPRSTGRDVDRRARGPRDLGEAFVAEVGPRRLRREVVIDDDSHAWLRLVLPHSEPRTPAYVRPARPRRLCRAARGWRAAGMPRAPLAVPAITGQKYSVQAWRDETTSAASGPRATPATRHPRTARRNAMRRKATIRNSRAWTVSVGGDSGDGGRLAVSSRHVRTGHFWPVIAGTAAGRPGRPPLTVRA
jgi:hypothetical protein